MAKMISRYRENDTVYCRLCLHSSAFLGNSCFCNAMKRRVCACDRYGRICGKFSKTKL